MNTKKEITVQVTVKAPIDKIWDAWTKPEHITKWNNASDDWHTPHAENDPVTGGRFVSRMEAKDGSSGFDFGGIYDEVIKHKSISYIMDGDDARKVRITFTPDGDQFKITETFEAENVYPEDAQRSGWQSILNNFKKYVEN